MSRAYKVTESILSQYMDDAQADYSVELYEDNALIHTEPNFTLLATAHAYGSAYTLLQPEGDIPR